MSASLLAALACRAKDARLAVHPVESSTSTNSAAEKRFPETIEDLRASWTRVATEVGVEAAGRLLYQRIFDIAPGALALFSFKDEPDMYNSDRFKQVSTRTVMTVNTAIGKLDDLDTLVPVLEGLGTKHIGFGVLPAHYDVVGQALLETLGLGLGESFTAPLKAAWAELYGIIKTTMVGSTFRYPAMALEHGRYAEPAAGLQASWTKTSQAAGMDWYTRPTGDAHLLWGQRAC